MLPLRGTASARLCEQLRRSRRLEIYFVAVHGQVLFYATDPACDKFQPNFTDIIDVTLNDMWRKKIVELYIRSDAHVYCMVS